MTDRIVQNNPGISEDETGTIYVVGIGPGAGNTMTLQAKEALDVCDVITGYKSYTDLVREQYPKKQIIESGMRQELERCRQCIDLAKQGKNVALICSGDAGVYGMASPMLEIAKAGDFEDVRIIPGVTAALSGAALLGAPLGHDLCIISLSDLLTPWEIIEKRLKCAAEGDFCIVIYNPASSRRKEYLSNACKVMLTISPPDRLCGYVRNIGRDGTDMRICTLSELAGADVDMQTTVFIGNSRTYSANGRLITPRGYTIG
ncbi:MAG: precorrin-3B C(17)-methyltransferase [Lachnospiraceae bacterium]|nr:precorrin-3B C(17)-methyltransferase [Lachnospiraceae bacterium]